MRHCAVALFLLGVMSTLTTGCRERSATESTGGEAVAHAAPRPSAKKSLKSRSLQWGDNVVLKEPFEKYALAHGIKLTAVMVEPFVEEHNDIFNGIRSEKGDVAIIPIEVIKIDNAKLAKVLLPIEVTRIRDYDAIVTGRQFKNDLRQYFCQSAMGV